MSIYLDLIWLLNAGLDTMLLLLCSVLLKRNVKWWRLLLGGLIGSLIVLLMFTPWSTVMLHPVTKLLFSVAMVWVTFGLKRFRFFLENILTFYFATFVVGGGLTGLHFMFDGQYLLFESTSQTIGYQYGDPVSWLFIIIAFPILFYFSKTRIEDLKMKNITFDQLVPVSIIIQQQELPVKGLIDSGNQLYDPLSQTPVMIVYSEAIKEMVPAELIEATKNVDDMMFYEHLSEEWQSRLRIIPFRTVGQSNQFMLAIKPDSVTIQHCNELINVHKVLIGISHTNLSPENAYQCIVHPKLLAIGTISPAS
ncbi:sigma-E processing peptidase SpoIIGA [Bacillus songklensis]|uniref:Sporulation sigma-E factor-processing peptidase n=1 Tax=Bacillus songklensis TaxID=1069116 RepID=A0ABV8AXG3_9BACI